MKRNWTVASLGLVLAVTPRLASGAGDASIDAIANAPDPSGVIIAYAQAARSGGDAAAADTAYVGRMADLGRPELAFDQSVKVVQRDPANGLAWAVLAYNYADRDEPLDTFTDLLLAVKHDAKNPFVVRTAGQLLAWYDSDLVQRDTLAASLRADVGTLRIRYGDNDMYHLAYAQAARTYAGAASDTTPPAPTAPAPPTPPVVAQASPSVDYPYPDQDNGLVYADSYPWALYGYYLPWWGWNPFWGVNGYISFPGGQRHHHHGNSGAGGGVAAAVPGAVGNGTSAGLSAGQSASTFTAAALPPGIHSARFQAITASFGAARTLSAGHSSSSSGSRWSTGGASWSAGSGWSSGGGWAGHSSHWSGSGGFSGRSSPSFTGSGGSRSFSGGFGQWGTSNYGGGHR